MFATPSYPVYVSVYWNEIHRTYCVRTTTRFITSKKRQGSLKQNTETCMKRVEGPYKRQKEDRSLHVKFVAVAEMIW